MNIKKQADAKKAAKSAISIVLFVSFFGVFAGALFIFSPFRLFVINHPGLIGVLIAVTGEVWLDWGQEIGKHAALKKFFMALLVVSLAYELYEASESDKKAADAIALAAQANLRASSNEVQVAEAKKDAASANERAAKFDADRVLIAKEAEEIRSTNFVLQTKLLELEGKQKPRALTSEQQTNLIECLSYAPRKGKIDVFASILDAEAMNYAKQLSDVLIKAGFESHCPSEFSDGAMLAVGPPGVSIVAKDTKQPSPEGRYIQKCFMSQGIEMLGLNSSNPNFGTNSLEIDVGQHY